MKSVSQSKVNLIVLINHCNLLIGKMT